MGIASNLTPTPSCTCGNDIAPRRYDLGYRTCLDCGQTQATLEIHAKAKRVMPMHRGNNVYLGTGPSARQYAKDITDMRRGSNSNE